MTKGGYIAQSNLHPERTTKTDPPFARVVGLFGMYLFHYTQPRGEAPAIYHVDHIPIPYSEYMVL